MISQSDHKSEEQIDSMMRYLSGTQKQKETRAIAIPNLQTRLPKLAYKFQFLL
jgi:hypothetical protein